MYKKIGTLFCSNAVLAGVASTFVCAEKDVKDIACKNDLDLETLRDSKVKQEDIEQINKEVVLVYVLISLGVLSLFVGSALIIRLDYLKKEKIQAIDKSWKEANFGGKLTFSLFSDHFDKQYMGESFSGEAKHLRKGAGFLLKLLEYGNLVDLEFIFASKAEKVYKKILKNPKLVRKEGYVTSHAKIVDVAKNEGWYNDVLELERFGFIFRCLYFTILKKKDKYKTEFYRFQVLLKKLCKLNQGNAICELMGFKIEENNGVFRLALNSYATGSSEILGKNGYYGTLPFQKVTGCVIKNKEQFKNLFGVEKPVTQQ